MSAWTTPKTWAYKESLASNDMNTYVKDNLSYLKDTVDALLPTGIMWIWPTDTAPTGYLLCRGQAISRTTYASLFAIIGTTYGVGDNSTTFNLPNGAGKVFVGKDSTQAEFDTLGETGGANTVTLAATQIPGHTHTFSGTSSDISANHTHSGPNHTHTGTVSTIDINHVHNRLDHTHTGTTDGESGHTHVPTGSDAFWCYDGGGGETNENLSAGSITGKKTTTGASSGHTHTFTASGGGAGNTDYMNANNTHNHTFTSDAAGTGQTGTVSSGHTHTYSGTTDAGTGGGLSHSNLQPYQVIYYIIKF
jgi:microcystin-dependent protein